jgi:hypothetical protein
MSPGSVETADAERYEASPQYLTMYWHHQGALKKVRAHLVRPGSWDGEGTHFIEPFESDGWIRYGGPMTMGKDLFTDKAEAVARAREYLQQLVASTQAKLKELALIESGAMDCEKLR